MPKRKPETQRLADIHQQRGYRAAVTDEADHDSAVDDGCQFFAFENVEQKAGEEGAGSQRPAAASPRRSFNRPWRRVRSPRVNASRRTLGEAPGCARRDVN